MEDLIACATCRYEVRAVLRICPKCGQNPREGVQHAVTIASLVADNAPPETLSCDAPGCGGTVAFAGQSCPYCEQPVGGTPWRLRGLDSPLELRPGEELVLGRAEGAAARSLLDHANVSKRHAIVRLEGAQLWVTDLHSLNGTFLDGERLLPERPASVTNDAELRLASDVVLRLERAP